MRGLAIVLVVAAAGCHATTSQEEDVQVAKAYCQCVDPGDATCVTEVMSALNGTTDECSTCVYENEKTCANMVQECTQLCESQIVNHSGGQP